MGDCFLLRLSRSHMRPRGGCILTTRLPIGVTFGMTKKVHGITIPALLGRAGTESAVERRVLDKIESGIAYNIGDLAAQLHLSPSHLQRLFKRETGVLMGEWLIALRLQQPAYLL